MTSYCKGNEPKYFCRIGKIQNNNFVLDKDPRWATRKIMRLNLIAEELFVSKKCVDKLIESDLNGFSFKQVFKKNNISNEIYQLYIENEISNVISFDSIKEIYKCPLCKREKYMLKTGFIKINPNVLDNIKYDIIKTNEKFGQIDADSMILISKKFYNYLVKEKLNKGMNFIPINLK